MCKHYECCILSRKRFQHKLSTKIIQECKKENIGTLIIGDIKTKKLVTEYKRGLNKSTQGRGTLGRFKTFLKYKGKNAAQLI